MQQCVQFVLGDADQPEVEVVGHQAAQFLQQQGFVPPAQFGQLVVGDAIGAALRLGQMAQNDHRRLGQTELRGGQDAPMPRDQLPVGRDEAGHGPAELSHARGDLCHLVGIVGLGIAGVGAETGQRPMLDPTGHEGRVHAASRLPLRTAKVSPVSASRASWPVKDCQRSMATST
jgi:hypothetical protein